MRYHGSRYNVYEYCDTSPVNYRDASGLAPEFICCRYYLTFEQDPGAKYLGYHTVACSGCTRTQCCKRSLRERYDGGNPTWKLRDRHSVTVGPCGSGGTPDTSDCTSIENDPNGADVTTEPEDGWSIDVKSPNNIVGCYLGCIGCNDTEGRCSRCAAECFDKHQDLCNDSKNEAACKLAAKAHFEAATALCATRLPSQ